MRGSKDLFVATPPLPSCGRCTVSSSGGPGCKGLTRCTFAWRPEVIAAELIPLHGPVTAHRGAPISSPPQLTDARPSTVSPACLPPASHNRAARGASPPSPVPFLPFVLAQRPLALGSQARRTVALRWSGLPPRRAHARGGTRRSKSDDGVPKVDLTKSGRSRGAPSRGPGATVLAWRQDGLLPRSAPASVARQSYVEQANG